MAKFEMARYVHAYQFVQRVNVNGCKRICPPRQSTLRLHSQNNASRTVLHCYQIIAPSWPYKYALNIILGTV